MFTTLFRTMSLARRLSLGFISMLMLLLAVAGTGAYAIQLLGDQVKRIVEVNNLKIDLASQLMEHISNLGLSSRSAALFGDLDKKQLDIEVQAAKMHEAAFLKAEHDLFALLSGSDGSDLERGLMADISLTGKKVLPEVKEAIKQAVDGDNVAAVLTLMNRVRPAESQLRLHAGKLIELQRVLSKSASTEVLELQQKVFAVGGILVLIALLMGGLIAWRITVSVTAPIERAVVVAERIAMGDLSSQVEVRIFDETGRLLQAIASMQDKLRDLVGGIRSAADSIQVASSEVASGNLDLSQRTEDSASKLQQTATSMMQLTETVQHSAYAAQQANTLALSAAGVAARGGAVVAEVVTTMNAINASSGKIADIVSVIDGIAFQTNILALNAAVEAARAGEQGRGFAVVASEVRTLAGRSAQAAKEIKMLIGTSVERVSCGTRLVADAGRTMTEIVNSVERVTGTLGEITAAAATQSEDIAQVNTAVALLDRMTQQNSALVEQSAAAAASLKDQAVQLSGTVSAFKLNHTVGIAPTLRPGLRSPDRLKLPNR